MSTPLIDALKILVSNYYVTTIDGKLQLTNKFHRELEAITPSELYLEPGKVELPEPRVVREVIRVNSKTKQAIVPAGQKSLLAKFIIDCEVPMKVKMSSGGFYWVNKYSKEAEAELVRILQQDYQLDILVAATKLYYKAGGYVETVSNFLVRGTWMTHYDEMVKQLEAGTTKSYIEQSLSDGNAGAPLSDDR